MGAAIKTLAIDPGSKPGYSVQDRLQQMSRRFCTAPTARIIEVATRYADLRLAGKHVDATATEGQDPASTRRRGEGKRVDERDILTLARTTGAQLYRAAICCTAAYVLPVRIWKNAVIVDGFGMPKAVYCNRIEASLHPCELALLNAVAPVGAPARLDVLDSIAINWALDLLDLPAKYAWKMAP